ALWGLRGVRPAREGAGRGAAGESPERSTRPLRVVVRTSMFWVVTGAVACSGLVSTAVYFHQIALLGERAEHRAGGRRLPAADRRRARRVVPVQRRRRPVLPQAAPVRLHGAAGGGA